MKTELTNTDLFSFLDVSASKTEMVQIKWNEEIQKWVPEIVDLVSDIEDGTIKSTWKTHLSYILILVLTFLTTYFYTGNKTTNTEIKIDSSSKVIDTTKTQLDSNKSFLDSIKK